MPFLFFRVTDGLVFFVWNKILNKTHRKTLPFLLEYIYISNNWHQCLCEDFPQLTDSPLIWNDIHFLHFKVSPKAYAFQVKVFLVSLLTPKALKNCSIFGKNKFNSTFPRDRFPYFFCHSVFVQLDCCVVNRD